VEYELAAPDGQLIGLVDGSRVYQVAHPGSIYLHQGRQYRVERLDTTQHRAVLEPADDCDEHTMTREQTDLSIVDEGRVVRIGPGTAHLGTVDVTSRVIAYQRKRSSTGETIDVVDLDLPPSTLRTRACWYTVPMPALGRAGVDPVRVLGSVHAAEHTLIGLLPLFTICDRWDVGGVSMALHPATGEPSIFVYDGYSGGAGIAELAFERLHEHLAAAHELIASCGCDDGCPSCVQSPKCGNWNEYLDKPGAAALLGLLST
jgi:DEAD/DEAH box helicase domain-containing protein